MGTELLLGQIVDTNSSVIGERLALAGIDSHFQTKVGDNHARIVSALEQALSRAEAVIVCGGLGPTQDDITRECLAEVMGAPLERDAAMVEHIRAMFVARGREMAANNARQADKPVGAAFIPNPRGTAPGLICPVARDGAAKVMYAVPGVPYEMLTMLESTILPDLIHRAGVSATIVSRTLRTWGVAESTLAEMVAHRFDAIDAASGAGQPAPTIAFLASGIEGIKVRLTAKAATAEEANRLLDEEDAEIRSVLGDIVFGVDDETMEAAVAKRLVGAGLTLAVAESVTGGLIASRLVNVAGAHEWFRGGIVSYAADVKRDLLGLDEGPVVSEAAARAMAEGVRARLRADVGLAITGVAGPDPADGHPVGTVFVGLAVPGHPTEAVALRMPGDRDRIRQFSTISALDALRHRLDGRR